MKNKIYRTLLLCTLVGCASCGQDGVGTPLPLDVSAEVGSGRTRAGDDHASDYDKRAFVAGDVIRIAKFGTSSGINYKRTATGTWAPVDEANPMTTTGGEKTLTVYSLIKERLTTSGKAISSPTRPQPREIAPVLLLLRPPVR